MGVASFRDDALFPRIERAVAGVAGLLANGNTLTAAVSASEVLLRVQ